MKKIYLNILGYKNFETNELAILRDEVEKMRGSMGYSSILWDSIGELKRKINIELSKRENSKKVWVEFVSYWSGYTSSQRRLVGRFYRKMDRDIAVKMPKYFEHQFTDNTSNAWNVAIVSVRGKDEGSYSSQIDDFIKSEAV